MKTRPEPKSKSKAKAQPEPKVDEIATLRSQNEGLQAELQELREAIAAAFEFGANELRPLFGQGTLALVFDGIAAGLRKKLDKEKGA